MNEQKLARTAQKQTNIINQNIRTLMQALHGCRKNCAECKEEEAEWEDKESKIKFTNKPTNKTKKNLN